MKSDFPAPFDEYAVIDLGSTSFHMIIARKVQERLQILNKIKHHVHLVSGLDENNRLSDKTLADGMKCLSKFAERLQGFPVQNVRIVATHTLRIAANQTEFIESAAQILPYPIEVISGQEEARLIYSALYTTQSEKGNKIVIDIGGGSTELAFGSKFFPDILASKELGCITMTERFFSDNKLNFIQFKLAQLIVEQEFENVIWEYKQQNWKTAFGTSGTIKAIYNILVEQGYSDGIITPDRLNALINKIHKAKSLQQIEFKSISADRKSLLLGGLVILSALFRSLDIKELHFSPNSLREGVLYELTDRQYDENIIISNIRILSKQYNIDLYHARNVCETAQHIYSQNVAQSDEKIDFSLRMLLYYAAYFHEIGLIINHTSLQKHSAYIIRNSQLSGLNQEQQLFLATLIRYHRRSIKIDELPQFSLFKRQDLLSLIQILRLSVLLNNQRQNDLPLEQLDVLFIKNKATVALPEQYLNNNALIQLDLEKEADYWKNINHWKLDIITK